MKNSQDRSKKRKSGQSPDPFLRAFLRRAVAIIASEKGFNDVSQAKLRALSDQLGLAESTYQQAIDRLKAPSYNLGLSRYEKDFAGFLRTEFTKIRGNVVTIRAERALVEVAESKYQIDAIRAHQLIQKIADDCGVATISHSDARQFAQQLVEDTIGLRHSIDGMEMDRLHRVCRKWGMDSQSVDRLAAETCARNLRRRFRRLTSVSLSILAAITIFTVGWWTLTGISRDRWNSTSQPTTTSAQSQTGVTISTPGWWDQNLMEHARKVGQQDKESQAFVKSLSELDEFGRAGIYKQLANRYLQQRRINPDLENFLISLFFLDPAESSANSMIDSIAESLAISHAQPLSVSQIRKSVFGSRILARLVHSTQSPSFAPSQSRSDLALQAGQRHFNTDLERISEAEFIARAEKELSIDQWANAVRMCGQFPEMVAAILTDLENRESSSTNTAIHELREITIRKILTKAPFQWTNCKLSIRRVIEQMPNVDEFVELAGNSHNPGLTEFVIDLSKTRLAMELDNLSANPTNSRKTNVFTVHEESLKKIKRQIRIGIKELTSKLDSAGLNDKSLMENENIELQQLPNLVVELIQLNNLQLALMQTMNGRLEMQRLQRLIESKNGFPLPTPTANLPTPSERRSLAESINRISSSATDQQSARISSLNEIESLVGKFPDLEYEHAAQMVAYFLKSHTERETLAIERALPAFANLPNILIALADILDDENLEAGSLLDRLESLGTSVATDGVSNREDLRKSLYRRGFTLQKSQLADEFEYWTGFQPILEQLFASRMWLLLTPEIQRQRYRELVVRWIENKFEQPGLWLREIKLIDQSANSVAKTIRLNSLWAHCYCRHHRLGVSAFNTKNDSQSSLQELIAVELLLFRELQNRVRKSQISSR